MSDKFIQDLKTLPVSFVCSKWLLEATPYIFNNDQEKHIKWKEILSEQILVDSKAICFIGSSCTGFSLSPENDFKPFSNESDVDVAIISGHHFDISWHHLRNLGTKLYSLTPREKNIVEDHVTRLIYWGTIATDKILQILPFAIKWQKAIDKMKTVGPTIKKEINFRIYKDFEALRAYQLMNLNQLKDKIIVT